MDWNYIVSMRIAKCLGIKNRDGKFIINPPSDTIVSEGSKVIVFGTKTQIEEMKSNLD